MSLFGKILDKLGFDRKSPAAARPTTTATASAPPASPRTAAAPPPASIAVPEVDVVAKLEGMAATQSQKLNWKTSIVDLLKLLGLDSTLEARKDLAAELGCPQEKMADSAQMNMWLHKAVLQRLAQNGGNIPKELL